MTPEAVEERARHWRDRITATVRGLKACGYLEGLKRLDLLRSESAAAGESEALAMALCMVLAQRDMVVAPVLHLAQAAGATAAAAPLVAHLLSDDFWPRPHATPAFADDTRALVVSTAVALADDAARRALTAALPAVVSSLLRDAVAAEKWWARLITKPPRLAIVPPTAPGQDLLTERELRIHVQAALTLCGPQPPLINALRAANATNLAGGNWPQL